MAIQAERQNKDLSEVMDFLEMICLNVSDVAALAISTSKIIIDNKTKLEYIESNMNDSLKDIESLKENKPTIDFINKQFKEQAEDISPE